MLQLQQVADYIFDGVIRKMMTPGKILLYILKVPWGVHISRKFHDSN